MTTLGKKLNAGIQKIKVRISGLVSQVIDKIKSVTKRATKTFKSNKYAKKLRSREEIAQSVKQLVSRVKELNSVEALKNAGKEIRNRLIGENSILRHFKSKQAFLKLLEPL